MAVKNWTVLELIVNNHPGVMSHICGLFSRRAFNVEGIICLPLGKGDKSRIWLKVALNDKLNQIIKQVRKLEDVYDVKICLESREAFNDLNRFFAFTGAQRE